MKLRIGVRPSALARAQADEAVALLRATGVAIDATVLTIATAGDRDKQTPLSRLEGSDFFTRDIEEALRDETIDLAVHSAKDLEDDPPADLATAAVTRCLSPHECLVARNAAARLATLSPGAVVGTSSIMRRAALLVYRPDLVVRDLRGTIGERLGQLAAGAYDAIIVAHAALLRLKLTEWETELIPPGIMPPHPLQGRLALQVRADRTDLIALCAPVHERE